MSVNDSKDPNNIIQISTYESHQYSTHIRDRCSMNARLLVWCDKLVRWATDGMVPRSSPATGT